MVGSILATQLLGFVAGTFSYAAATFAINFAVSYVVTRVFGSKPPQSQDTGARQQVPPANNNSIPVVYGDAWLGGTFVDAVLSTDQKTMYYVLAISSISSDASATFSFDRTKFYYGDRLVTFDNTDLTKVVSLTDGASPPNVDDKISGKLYISLYTSTNAGVITAVNGTAPNVTMGGADIPAALRWPSSGRQMNGLAFAIVKLNYNADAGTTGLLPITFYCKHYPKGGTVAKPGDVWYDYMTDVRYGAGMTGLVDSASATALNTYSDQTITYTPSGGGSATQARYRINGVVDTGKPVLDNVEKMLECCDSWMAYNAASGLWSVVINKAETSSFSFNDTNLIGEIRVSAVDINQQINQIQIEFPSKLNRDQPDLVYMETPAGLLYPNEPANRQTTTLEFTNDSVQAQYLGNRRLEQAREDLIVTITSTYPGIQVDAGDVVDITNADYGWTNKLFRVMKVSEATVDDGNLGATLELSEYNAQVYDDATITAFTAAPNSSLPAAAYFSSLTAPTFTNQLPAANFPSFDVVTTIPATGRVTQVTLFYTTSATPSATDWKEYGRQALSNGATFTNSSTLVFTNISLPGATYYFAFSVSNEVAASGLSPTSSGISWSPIPSGQIIGDLNAARIIFLQQSQTLSAPATPSPTSGPTSVPAGWTTTNPGIIIGQVIWASFGEYDPATNITTWATPQAFTLFQSILSDNYNGPIPPTSTSYGTTGWYLDKVSGSLYANSAYLRGELVTGTAGAQRIEINKTSANKVAIYNSANQLLGYFGGTGSSADPLLSLTPQITSGYALGTSVNLPVPTGSNVSNAYFAGLSDNSTLAYVVNVSTSGRAAVAGTTGYTGGVGSGYTGVLGYDGAFDAGGRFQSGTGGTEVSVCDSDGYALNLRSGSFRYNSYTISAPTGSTTTFLRADGTWATPSGGSGTVTSVSGTGTVSGITLSGTVTTSGSLTLGGTLSLTSGNVTSALGYTPLSTTGQAYDSARLDGLSASSWARIFPGNSGRGTANASGSGLNVVTGTGLVGTYEFYGSGNTLTLQSVSDRRLKENITDESLGLEFVKQLRPVTFTKPGYPLKFHGFIADDVWQVLSEANDSLRPLIPTDEYEGGLKGFDYISMIGPLVKAIQDLNKKVEELNALVNNKT